MKLNYYAVSLLSNAALLFISWQLIGYIGDASIFMVSILTVIFNIWLAGFKFGAITTIIAAINSTYLLIILHRVPSSNYATSVCGIVLFIIAGMVLSFIIDKYKKTDLLNEYKRKEAEYTKKYIQLEEECNKMKQGIKLRDEFLSITSHELKTPLTSMLLKIQTILHNIRNVSLANFSVENLLKMLETAEQQTQRLSRLINDLLNVSLITTGNLNLEVKKEDIVALVKEVVNEFTEKLETNGYKLKVQATEPVSGYVDKMRIEQVVTNVIANAIKYGKGKPIDIEVSKHGSNASIMIRDHGIGIESSKINSIFTLFERGNTVKNYEGLGVGLYITSQIIKAHKGNIKVESNPGIGSTFTIELPQKSQTKNS